MSQAKSGDIVKVHYTGTLNDGTVFDSSVEREPIQFTIGDKKLLPHFEKAVVGMEPGQKEKITIPHKEAYGPHRKELVLNVEREKIPEGIDPKVGQMLQFEKEAEPGKDKGDLVVFTVVGVTNTHLALDANHPLAGKDLTFELELVEIL